MIRSMTRARQSENVNLIISNECKCEAKISFIMANIDAFRQDDANGIIYINPKSIPFALSS